MANDRMYIRCKGCGDLHYLAKCYDDGYFTTHEGEELRQGLDDFFDRHKWCYRDKYYGGFELVYESDEDAENEGEDERIRKWLVNYFKAAGKSWIHRDISPEQILAYLEKQKEPENTSASTMAPSCWEVEQKEQKPKAKAKSPLSPHELYDAKIEGISQGRQDVLDHPEQFGLQKPAEWSEEDEKIAHTILNLLCSQVTYVTGQGTTSGKQFPTYAKERDWLENRFKSLRPQYHGDVTMTEAYKMGLEAGKASSWKPSEEQMAALEAATVRYQSTGLESLYEDLKKL